MPSNEEQYFGLTTKAFVNDVYNVVDDYFADSIDLLERELLKQAKGDAKERVKAGCDKILKVIRHLCDRNFDKFEVYLARNIFYIPKDIALDELYKERAKAYRENVKSVSTLEDDEAEIDRAIQAAQHELASLTAETARLRRVVVANKTEVERMDRLFAQVKRKTGVNPETLRSIVASGAVLDSNTDKFVEMISRFGEPEEEELSKPLQLDIDSCKSFCSKLENSLGQPSHELLVTLNKQLCS